MPYDNWPITKKYTKTILVNIIHELVTTFDTNNWMTKDKYWSHRVQEYLRDPDQRYYKPR